jgi:endo-1,4-beta-xylanase
MNFPLCRRSLLGSLAFASSPAVGIEAGLRDVAARAGVSFGSAVVASVLDGDPSYAALVAREAALLVPEGDAKWDVLQPSPGRFEFGGLDRILGFAASQGQTVRGHTLVWGMGLPRWVLETEMTAARAQSILESHIAAVLGFTRGRIMEWDVVNEPIADSGPRSPRQRVVPDPSRAPSRCGVPDSTRRRPDASAGPQRIRHGGIGLEGGREA